MSQEEHLRQKIEQKTRVRKQQKRKISDQSGTVSRELKRQELASKRKKGGTKVSVRIKRK